MKGQRGGGVFIINFQQQHNFLLNYYYKTINMFRKPVKIFY